MKSVKLKCDFAFCQDQCPESEQGRVSKFKPNPLARPRAAAKQTKGISGFVPAYLT